MFIGRLQVIQQLPWESMNALESTPISRVPSLFLLKCLAVKHGFLLKASKAPTVRLPPTTDLQINCSYLKVNPKLAFYVLNPAQDLPGVQERLQPILERIWGKQCGVSGAVPVEKEIKHSLTDLDVFL